MRDLKELGRILFFSLLLLLLGLIHHTAQPVQTISNTKVSRVSAPVSRSVNAPVFMYHHVGDLPKKLDRYRKDLTVSTADFKDQIKYLSDNGYQCISTVDLYKYQLGEIDLNKKPCVITFDDGFDDAFQNAIPVLVENKMVGSFAIITQYVGNPEYASWDTISNAQKQGMDIISHSQHHIDFTSRQYSYQDKDAEVRGSLQDIKDHLGINTVAFVYPYGHFDSDTEKIVKANGIKFAFNTAFGDYDSAINPYEMPRVRVHGGENISTFADLLKIAQGK